MKSLIAKAVLLAVLTVPMLVACGSPASGNRDVLSPDQVKAHFEHKKKAEGGD